MYKDYIKIFDANIPSAMAMRPHSTPCNLLYINKRNGPGIQMMATVLETLPPYSPGF